MMIRVLNLGTNWWTRRGPDGARSSTAHYNSTGVRTGRKVRRHWIVPGLVRFNGVGDVNPQRPNRAIGSTFVCSDLTEACGGTRILFKSKAPRLIIPDCYLVVISASVYGRIDFGSPVWKAAVSPVIAASQLRDQQEAMLLMNPGDWVQTSGGFWQLSQPRTKRDLPALVRVGDPISV